MVSDRARWFQVVMGERYRVDEAATETLAERVPFPEEAARELMFDFSVVGSEERAAVRTTRHDLTRETPFSRRPIGVTKVATP